VAGVGIDEDDLDGEFFKTGGNKNKIKLSKAEKRALKFMVKRDGGDLTG